MNMHQIFKKKTLKVIQPEPIEMYWKTLQTCRNKTVSNLTDFKYSHEMISTVAYIHINCALI